MEITPEMSSGSSAKRTRAKPKVTVKAATPPVAAKKPRAPRKTLTTKTVAEAPVTAVAAEPILEASPTDKDVGGMIAMAAYFLAAARNFMPGHELEDWLAAERSVRAKLPSP